MNNLDGARAAMLPGLPSTCEPGFVDFLEIHHEAMVVFQIMATRGPAPSASGRYASEETGDAGKHDEMGCDDVA